MPIELLGCRIVIHLYFFCSVGYMEEKDELLQSLGLNLDAAHVMVIKFSDLNRSASLDLSLYLEKSII